MCIVRDIDIKCYVYLREGVELVVGGGGCSRFIGKVKFGLGFKLELGFSSE